MFESNLERVSVYSIGEANPDVGLIVVARLKMSESFNLFWSFEHHQSAALSLAVGLCVLPREAVFELLVAPASVLVPATCQVAQIVHVCT